MSSDTNPIEPRLLKGFRDFLPNKAIVRNQLIQRISQKLTLFGFLPLETPVLEYAEILQGKLGDEGEKLLYQFRDHGDRQVAMRYDFTVPLARVAAQYPELPKPFKRYQVGPVWRADNTQRGRFREFYQFDLDIVGSASSTSDAEILVLMQEILLALGISNFKIKVNDRNYLASIAEKTGLDSTQMHEFYLGLDKWDKIGGQSAVEEYWAEHGLTSGQIGEITRLLHDTANSEHPVQLTVNQAIALGLKPENVDIDPSIVRGLDYYTGIVFETTLTDAPDFGSIFSGGRYDNLVERFTKQHIPAVGASVGLDRLMAAMDQLHLLPEVQTTTTAFVTVFNADLQESSLATASQLREAGIATEVSYTSDQIGKQLKLAAAKSIPYAIIIGPDEAAKSLVTLRDLATGQEQTISIQETINQFKR